MDGEGAYKTTASDKAKINKLMFKVYRELGRLAYLRKDT